MFSSRNWALLSAFSTAVIFGISFTIGGQIVEKIPYTLIVFVRGFATCFLFWICGFFIGKQPPFKKKHYGKLIICALCGAFFNQLFAYKALETTKPIAASAINITTPIIVLLFSAILMRKKIPCIRITGAFIGFIGGLFLIFHKGFGQDAATSSEIIGNFYMFLNAVFYAFFLILARELLEEYHLLHIAKWMYTISLPIVFLFAFPDFEKMDWQTIPQDMYFKFFYIVFFVTFLNYLLSLFALSKLKPTTVSVFVYLQPVVASIYALFVGRDRLSFFKISAVLLVCLGVYLAGKETKIKTK